MKAPFFHFYVGDYLADTMGLSCCEHGVYLLLLAVSWQRGPLPDDMDHLARLAADPPIESLRYILETYWTRTERGWLNQRLERERAAVIEKSRKARAAAEARWAQEHDGCERIANAMQTHSGRNANQISDIRTEESITHHSSGESPKNGFSGRAKPAKTPFSEIWNLWREMLPELPAPHSPEHWTSARKAQIRARWNDQLPDLDAWRQCFELVRKSPFLMGKVNGTPGRRPFRADLFWVTKPENLLKIYEGKYHA